MLSFILCVINSSNNLVSLALSVLLLPPMPLCNPFAIVGFLTPAFVCFSLRLYNSLVERCFRDCVESFRRKTLDRAEEGCVKNCAEKFLKHTTRVGLRLAELQGGASTMGPGGDS